MNIISITFSILAPIFLVIGAAAVYGKIFKPDTATLSGVVIYVFVPALVLRTVAQSQLALRDVLAIGGTIVLFTLLIVGIGTIATKIFRVRQPLVSGFLVSVVMVNAANYGIPLNEFAFGAQGMQIATIYYILTVIIGNNTGIFIASQGSVGVRQALINVLRVPVFPATLLGILLNVTDTALPLPLDRALTILGGGTVPAMLALLGIRLATMRFGKNLMPALLAVALRLAVAPLLVTPIALLLGLRGIPLYVTIIQTSTPTAVLAAAVSAEFGADADFVSTVTLISTLLSILSISVLLALMGVQSPL